MTDTLHGIAAPGGVQEVGDDSASSGSSRIGGDGLGVDLHHGGALYLQKSTVSGTSQQNLRRGTATHLALLLDNGPLETVIVLGRAHRGIANDMVLMGSGLDAYEHNWI